MGIENLMLDFVRRPKMGLSQEKIDFSVMKTMAVPTKLYSDLPPPQ